MRNYVRGMSSKKKNEAGNPYLITNVNGATDDHLMRTIRQKPKISNNC